MHILPFTQSCGEAVLTIVHNISLKDLHVYVTSRQLCEREREREREADRQTDTERQTDRETETERDS